jgi:hypothetical protein
MTADELADLYDASDGPGRAEVLAEADRRDRADAGRARGRERYAATSGEWYDAAHAQYLDAEAVTRGNLLSRQAEAEGIGSGFELWRGPEAWAMPRASEELRNYWLDHPRMTVTEYTRQQREARRLQREERQAMDDTAEADMAGLDEFAPAEEAPPARPAGARGTSYADITPMAPDWLWAGRVAFGEVTIVAAKGGTGKTFALCDLAARVTRGDVLPGGTPAGPAGSVMIVNAEDDPSTVLVHRLTAARADLARVIDFSEPDGAPFVLGAGGTAASIAADCTPMLHEAVTAAGDVRLVILDPLAGISAVSLTTVVRIQGIMRALRRVARDTGVAIVVIHHLTKGGDIAGSKAVVDAVRSVLLIERAEDGTRIVSVAKGNNVSEAAAPIRYRITGDGTAAHIEWLGEAEESGGREGGPAQDRILAALRLAERPLTGQELAARTATPYGSVRVILHKLAKRGEAVTVARGLWCAAPEQPQASALTVVS